MFVVVTAGTSVTLKGNPASWPNRGDVLIILKLNYVRFSSLIKLSYALYVKAAEAYLQNTK